MVASSFTGPYRRFQDRLRSWGCSDVKRRRAQPFLNRATVAKPQTIVDTLHYCSLATDRTAPPVTPSGGKPPPTASRNLYRLWFISWTLLLGYNVGRTKPRPLVREHTFGAAKVPQPPMLGSFAPEFDNRRRGSRHVRFASNCYRIYVDGKQDISPDSIPDQRLTETDHQRPINID